jgi:hypothetical protein
MHGRIHLRPLRTGAPALIAALAVAGPAGAAPPFTSACSGDARCLGLDQPTGQDGVVVLWRVNASAPQSAVRLETRQPAGVADTTRLTAASDALSLEAGVTREIPVRLPIAVSGTLALGGASGAVRAEGVVEPDADGDGYGDTSQDGCPGNAHDQSAPCDATTTFGSPLTLAPDVAGLSSSGAPEEFGQGEAPGTILKAGADGILTSWRFRSAPEAGTTVLQLLRPSSSSFTVVAESAPAPVTTKEITTLPAQVAVKAGDVLAVRSVTGDIGAVGGAPGNVITMNSPPATLGQTWTPTDAGSDIRLLAQADVEPDADGDGKGDVTQDRADLIVTASAPAEVFSTTPYEQTFTIRNAGPDAALGVRVALGAGASGATGPGCGTGPTCDFGTLAPGASVAIHPVRIEASIYPPLPGVRGASAMATAITTDPDASNNGASLSTNLVATPRGDLPAFVIRPCTNVIRGTRDDDVVRGTAFGDRLVGNDGDDLLKGLGAGDCLEGGAGDDVLDGGDGDDRLNGSSGKDRLSGGNGNDKLTGGRGNDRISGGPGNDTISPGDGKDVVTAGGGNDTINAVDGVRESIDCGAGKDAVRADRRDRLKGCEKVTRRR